MEMEIDIPRVLSLVAEAEGYAPKPKVNPQLLSSHPEVLDELVKMQVEGDALHGQRPPNQVIVHEKPEHYVIVFLKARGHSNREVAEKTGYTEAWISQICRQTWFMKKLLAELRASGRDSVSEFLNSTVEDNILRTIQLRDTAKSEAIQLAAAIDLNNRALGKPIQRSIELKVPTKSVVDRFEDMQAELDSLKAREQELEQQLKTAVA